MYMLNSKLYTYIYIYMKKINYIYIGSYLSARVPVRSRARACNYIYR